MKPETFKYMPKLGIPANLKGYKYIAYFLEELSSEVPDCKFTVLYEEIGKHFGSRGSRAERAMRHAIQNSWTSIPECDLKTQLVTSSTYQSTGCPTLSSYLTAVALDYRQSMGQSYR